MLPPAVRVNTFVPMKETSLDRVSKIFIIFDLICGINRLSVFGKLKPICFAISLAFSLSVNILVIYLAYIGLSKDSGEVVRLLKLWQYGMCTLLGFAFRKRLRDFFLELNKFGKKIGFRRENKDVIKSFAEIFLTMCIVIISMNILQLVYVLKHHNIDTMITLVINILELHFFGHLLSLLIPRLRFINYLMKQSLSNRSGIRTVQKNVCPNKTKHPPPKMREMMDSYHRIIIAYDTLYEAIKWQMTIIFVTSFFSSLIVSYRVILRFIHNKLPLGQLLVQTILAASEMVPMLTPCRIVDTLRGEAQCLMELLSSKLYESKIEKSKRSVAQAFLALMEACDLSFSLLRIFDIDVSFPFKFLGLLVTYLIILLQFEKVINLDRGTL